MRAKSRNSIPTMAALGFALAIALGSPPAEGRGHASNAWIMALKCQDLVGTKIDAVNTAMFPVYSVWLRGYIAGISSVATVSITENVRFSDVVTSVLTYCTSHQKESAVEASVHVGSLFYNVLNSSNQAIDLHNPGSPALQD